MLARELHDGVGQMLFGLQLKLAAKPNHTDDLKEEVGDLKQTIDAVSKLSRLLHPPELEHADLVTAIDQNLTTADPGVGPVIGFESRGREVPLTPTAKNHLYRIAQEAITNARKHAKAGHVRIEMDWTADSVALRVEDDGAGFPVQARHGLGLRSIQTRASAIGGHAEWRHNPSGGVTLEIAAPLERIVASMSAASAPNPPAESPWPTPMAGEG